jgi:hypothetical protein
MPASEAVSFPSREVPVIEECDVLIVGGGPAGVAAAIAAARLDVRVVLVESQSFLGGLGTGGSVLLWPGFCREGSYAFGGVAREVLQTVDRFGGVYYGTPYQYTRHGYVNFDSEMLRYALQELVLDSRITLLQHLTAVDAVMDRSRVDAVIFHSKAGFAAIRGRVVIDATGDGDIIAFSGASCWRGTLPLSSAWCIGGVSFDAWELDREEPYANMSSLFDKDTDAVNGDFYRRWRKICKQVGFHVHDPLPMPHRNALWTDGTVMTGLDALNPADLTRVDVEGRRAAAQLIMALRQEMPGFEGAYVYQFNTLTGVRAGRLLDGVYCLSDHDITGHSTFDDCIGIGDQCRGEHHFFEIPYRCLLPKTVDNLLASGRCLSATPPSNRMAGAFQEVREIPHCMVTGQAAGVAAALAVTADVSPNRVQIRLLQNKLREQNVRFEPDESVPLSPGSRTRMMF